MERQRIDLFLIELSKKIPPERIPEVESILNNVDERQFLRISSIDYKDVTTMLLISIFLGGWGVDRFMLGDIGMGVLKLLTGGLCGVLWIIDIINSGKMTRDYNFNQFMQAVNFSSFSQ